MNTTHAFTALSPTLHIVIGVLIAVQLVLIMWNLIELYRFPKQKVLGLPKLVWILIVIFGQLIGSIIALVCLHIAKSAVQAQAEWQSKELDNESTNHVSHRTNAQTIVSELYDNHK